MIREMQTEDSTAVLDIYKMGIETRNATFETEVPSWQQWDNSHVHHSRFVFLDKGKVMGWSALSPISERCVYRGVAEISIYVDTRFSGKGIGSKLLERTIASSEENEIWSLYSSVFPENKATLRLHEKFGFRVIGYREKIAQLDGKWRDTLLLERRSNKPEYQ